MATFTSTLPDDLFNQLSQMSITLSMPKNRIIEKALRLFLEHLEKAEYIKSYAEALEDRDILLMAEEGMADYLKQIE